MKRFPIGLSVALLFAIVCVAAAGATPAATSAMPDLTPLKGTPDPVPPADKDKFTFIVAGDNRPHHSSDPQGDEVKEIFDDINAAKPAFVLWSGDTISGKDPKNPTRIVDEYKEFLAIAKTGGVAVYNAPGNHEMADKTNCPSAEMLKLYLDNNKQNQPYGAFTYGHSRFIALDTDDDEGPPPAGCSCTQGGQPSGFIGKTQLKLLEDDLAANTDKAHIFIFMHRPLKGYQGQAQLCPDNVTYIQNMFKKYTNVSFVLAGHQHLYYNPQGPNDFGPPPERTDPSQPPYYLVTGGAGAPLDSGGFYNYLIFKIDGDKVRVKVVALPEKLDPQQD